MGEAVRRKNGPGQRRILYCEVRLGTLIVTQPCRIIGLRSVH
jgi:hypothetical protein